MKTYLLTLLISTLVIANSYARYDKAATLSDFVVSTSIKKSFNPRNSSLEVSVSDLHIFGGSSSDEVSLGFIRNSIGEFINASSDYLSADDKLAFFYKDITIKEKQVRVAFILSLKPFKFVSACFNIPLLGKTITCKGLPKYNSASAFSNQILDSIVEEDDSFKSMLERLMNRGKKLVLKISQLSKI